VSRGREKAVRVQVGGRRNAHAAPAPGVVPAQVKEHWECKSELWVLTSRVGKHGKCGCEQEVLSVSPHPTMSAPQLGVLVVRVLSSSRDFKISENTSALVFSEPSKSREDETLRTKRKPNCGALIPV
jgi:hypothetical protein